MWLRIKEVADRLDKSVKTIRRQIKKGIWETKEEQVGPGRPTILVWYDSKLDTSEGSCSQERNISSKEEISKLDTLVHEPNFFVPENEKSHQSGHDFAQPAVQSTLKSVKCNVQKAGKVLKNSALAKLDTAKKDNSKLDIGKKGVQFTKSNETRKENLSKLDTSDSEKQSHKLDIAKLDTSKVDILKVDTPEWIDEKELKNSLKWIPIDRAVGLSGYSRRTIYNKISSQDLFAVTMPDKVSKFKTYIKVDGFTQDVQMKWQAEIMKSSNSLSVVLLKEQQEFEIHTSEEKNRAWNKKAIVDEYLKFRDYAKANKISLTKAGRDFEIKLNNREILSNVMKQLDVVTISIKTIKKWEKALRDSGNTKYPISLLEHRKGSSGRKKVVSSSLESKIKKLAVDFRDIKSTEIYRLIEEEFTCVGQEMPISPRTVLNIVTEARKDAMAVARAKGKKAYKDSIRPHVHRINNAMPGDIWESDGHPMNNLIYSPFYAHKPTLRFLVRPQLIAWYDIATGVITGHALCIAENQNVVRTSLRDGIEHFGVPAQIRVDNGSGYKNVNHTPHFYAGKKRNTASKKKALEMIARGDNGLYKNLGISYSFTIPGNPESKMIEPFWGFCVSQFEKAFPVWIGNKIEKRPEVLKLTNKKLIKKYGKYIPTWEQYEELLKQFIEIWNNRKRSVLTNGKGESMSPLEAYTETTITIPSQEKLDRIMKFPYPSMAKVNRGEIFVNGIYYSHPIFMALQNRQVQYFYDERDITEVTIASEFGEVFEEKAKIVYPALQVGDDMASYIETKHREKIGRSVYSALDGVSSVKGMHRALAESSENTIDDQERIQNNQKHASKLHLHKGKPSRTKINAQAEDVTIDDSILDNAITEANKLVEDTSNKEPVVTDEMIESAKQTQVDEDKNREYEEAFKKLGIG